jgi:hypothetical protein
VAEFTDADLKGSRFWRVDLSGSRFHDVGLRDVKITDTFVHNLEISGVVGRLVVNEVDVSAFVREELDRRQPERKMLRAKDADGLRAAWAMIEARTDATLERAKALPTASLDVSVDEEWSYLQTLRHLVFATDRWITGPVLDDPNPWHPLGVPPGDPKWGAVIGLDLDATPTLDEVLEVRRGRMASVADLLRDASSEDLARTVVNPNGGSTSVMSCVHVVLKEEWEHDRYANRDLEQLERDGP